MSQYRLYDPLTARWNGVDALAEKYHSSGSYNYVLGNPVRLGDKDGRDTTVYVYFDPKNSVGYFKYAANRKEYMDNLRYFIMKNGLNLNVVETTRSYNSIKQSLDWTDQYLDLSDSNTFQGQPIHSFTSGVTYQWHSRVNLGAPNFNNKHDYYPLKLVLNTGLHEVFHGLIARSALDYAPWNVQYHNQYMDSGSVDLLTMFPFNFDSEGHYKTKGNIMMDADTRNSHKNPTGFIGVPDIAPLLYNSFTNRSEFNANAPTIQSTELLLQQHKKLLQGWFKEQLK